MSIDRNDIASLEHRFFSLGKKVNEYYSNNTSSNLFNEKEVFDKEFLEKMYDPFSLWTQEDSIVKVLGEYKNIKTKTKVSISLKNLIRWVKNHRNDPDSVINCMSALPPARYDINKQLPQTGKQKLVFHAYEQYSQTDKILKKILVPGDNEENIITSELRSATLKHPNIIETNFKHNINQEPFFIEDVLHVLNDGSKVEGTIDAINLMFDVVSALILLHDQDIVHLDIKPDNIGLRDGRYILLDFGVCRSIKSIEDGKDYATGSFRTRAPELFINNKYSDPKKADVYSLGASVYRLLFGKYPFIEESEKQFKTEKEKQLTTDRIIERLKSYGEIVFNPDFNKLDAPLKEILKGALDASPDRRITASKLREELEYHFASHIRKDVHNLKLTPLEEFEQIRKSIDLNKESIDLIPLFEKDKLKTKLKEIAKILHKEKSDASNREIQAKVYNYLDLFSIPHSEIEE